MRQIKAALLRDPDRIRRALGLDRIRILICCALFLGAALIKFLSPGATFALRRFVFGELEQSDNYTAAFSAVGETLSDSEKLSRTFGGLCESLFGDAPDPGIRETGSTAAQTAIPVMPLSTPGEEAIGRLRQQARLLQNAASQISRDPVDITHSLPKQADESSPATEPEPEEEPVAEVISPATLEYDYPELEPPEGIRLDYVPLTLDYTLPLSGAVSSVFGYRLHPLSGEVCFHNGLDIAGNAGDDVLCFADGVVRAAGEHPNLGKYYIITHADGVETVYGHLSQWLVSEGSTVSGGQVIGKVGQSGTATGPHLHLEIFVDGVRVNPLYYFRL